MDGLDAKFMRLQTFQNNNQQNSFINEVKTFEKYKEKNIINVTQYCAWIQFNFLNCIPLNILINGITYKYFDVQKKQIKNILIAILEHYLQLQKQQFHHGNIQSQNIIVEFQRKQNSDNSSNGFEIKKIYFTNYTFVKKSEDDEREIINQIFDLLGLIDSHYPIQFNKKDKIKDILYQIKLINIDQENNGWKNKLYSIFWKGDGYIKTLSQKINQEYPKVENEMNEQINIFNDNQNKENSDSLNNQQNQKEFQTTNEFNQTHTQNQEENNEQKQKLQLEKKWQELIQNSQQEFFEKLKQFFLLQFVENVTSYTFNPYHVKNKKNNQEKNQVYQDNKTQNKVQQDQNLMNQDKAKPEFDHIINKCFIEATVSFKTLLDYFNGIQTTFQEEWNRISNDHFSNYKFDFDLDFKDLVVQHFNEFFSQNSNYISSTKQIADVKMETQQKLIIQQFSDKYDHWISYKILDLISNLI
ncbi:unnamed protein product [Paramecium pentaurelia]|uniref:Protein kinase domain-containing protein n=1 Tax=Paramecium pentaurelia TaxID=43138 RepID=A0A8S1TC87_9CILI|nr:unnamed protein product [Paramecium pentaurelia]